MEAQRKSTQPRRVNELAQQVREKAAVSQGRPHDFIVSVDLGAVEGDLCGYVVMERSPSDGSLCIVSGGTGSGMTVIVNKNGDTLTVSRNIMTEGLHL